MNGEYQNTVYLSEEQFTELKTNGTITVDGQTVVYDEDTIYITPEETPDKTLSVSGKAADAQAVGEKIAEVQTSAKLYKHCVILSDTADGIRYQCSVYSKENTAYTLDSLMGKDHNELLTIFMGALVWDSNTNHLYYIGNVINSTGTLSVMFIGGASAETKTVDIIRVTDTVYEI